METKVEICILAGGLSSRMGRDKSKLRFAGRTLLARIRRTASELDVPVRIIRRDLVPRSGPLGGIYTALKTTCADVVLFLACDMPNISAPLLERTLKTSRKSDAMLFTWHNSRAGFPFVLSSSALAPVEKLLNEKQFSLQILAQKTRAKKFRPGQVFASDLLNINTPEDWTKLRALWKKTK